MAPDLPEVSEIAHDLLGSTSWLNELEDHTEHQTALYFIRLVGQKPFQRWLHEDPIRLLYIGQTGKGTKQRRKSRTRRQHALDRLKRLAQQINWPAGQSMKWQICYCALDQYRDEERCLPRFWEANFIQSYYQFHGEIPPLNRKLERMFGTKKQDREQRQKHLATIFREPEKPENWILDWSDMHKKFLSIPGRDEC